MEMWFDMSAWEQIERGICAIEALEDTLREALKTQEGIMTVCRLAAILRNAALARDGAPETETAETVLEGLISAQDLMRTVQEISGAIADGMRVEGAKSGPVDVTLAELDRRDGKRRVTWRKIAGEGLIAGVSLRDQRHAKPGLLVQLYRQRQQYDDEQHGIKRRAKQDF